MLKKIMKCSERKKQQYKNEVNQYIKKNGIIIVKKIYDRALKVDELTIQHIKEVIGEDFPKAPWIDSKDIVAQFICLLEQVGYDFNYDENGNVCYDDMKIYKAIVQNHLKLSGCHILDELARCCEETNGRVTYIQMQTILGLHYPKALRVSNEDSRVGIILFLEETGLPFKFDEEYIFFP